VFSSSGYKEEPFPWTHSWNAEHEDIVSLGDLGDLQIVAQHVLQLKPMVVVYRGGTAILEGSYNREPVHARRQFGWP
jgi:hypothetical protein